MKEKLLKLLGPAAQLGATAAVAVNPGLAPVLGAINRFLPDGQKLPETATGPEIVAAAERVPSSAELEAELDRLEVETAGVNLGHMVAADLAGSSTRPHIALLMAYVVAVSVSGYMAILMLATIDTDQAVLAVIGDTWELALVLLGTPSALLRAYFGMRSREKRARYAAATGQDVGAGGVMGALGGLLGRR